MTRSESLATVGVKAAPTMVDGSRNRYSSLPVWSLELGVRDGGLHFVLAVEGPDAHHLVQKLKAKPPNPLSQVACSTHISFSVRAEPDFPTLSALTQLIFEL